MQLQMDAQHNDKRNTAAVYRHNASFDHHARVEYLNYGSHPCGDHHPDITLLTHTQSERASLVSGDNAMPLMHGSSLKRFGCQ